MGLPGLDRKTFKFRENIIGQAVEAVANKSCEEIIEKEKVYNDVGKCWRNSKNAVSYAKKNSAVFVIMLAEKDNFY